MIVGIDVPDEYKSFRKEIEIARRESAAQSLHAHSLGVIGWLECRAVRYKDKSMFARAVVIWCVLLVIASLNGALREVVLIPRTGDVVGRIISTLLLSAFIVILTWLSIGWIGPRTTDQAWFVGVGWVLLTLAFEFLAGHYLFHNSWSNLLADYNLLRGRIWPLVLITTLVAPRLCAGVRGQL